MGIPSESFASIKQTDSTGFRERKLELNINDKDKMKYDHIFKNADIDKDDKLNGNITIFHYCFFNYIPVIK